MSCKLAEFSVKAKVGDRIKFYMPGFCSGDYTYEVTKNSKGELVLLDAPERIFDGCISYNIIRSKNPGN